jgi:hypothetical protein
MRMSISKIQFDTKLIFHLALLLTFVVIPQIASTQDDEGIENYKVRVMALWFRSSPTVTLEAAGHNGLVNFSRDFNFNDYSTFSGKFDWKFTRKNHLYFVVTPFNQSREAVLNRTITFRGQAFNVGLSAKAELRATSYGLGYQYDFIRRKRGHLGISLQANLIDTKGTFSAAAQVTGDGVHHSAVSAEASLLAPIPVAGPEYRLYLISERLFVEGNLYGMYLFGYGNYISNFNQLGIAFGRHLAVKAGYAYASRLVVNDSNNRVGLNLDQRGPTAGFDMSF